MRPMAASASLRRSSGCGALGGHRPDRWDMIGGAACPWEAPSSCLPHVEPDLSGVIVAALAMTGQDLDHPAVADPAMAAGVHHALQFSAQRHKLPDPALHLR